MSNSVQSFPTASLGKMCCILSELFVITKHEMLPALPPPSSPRTPPLPSSFLFYPLQLLWGQIEKTFANRSASNRTTSHSAVEKYAHTHRQREKWELALLMSCACHLPLPPPSVAASAWPAAVLLDAALLMPLCMQIALDLHTFRMHCCT